MKGLTFVKITHSYIAEIDEDRRCKVDMSENGDFQIQWESLDKENGAAYVSTKVQLSHEAAVATALLLAKIFSELEASGELLPQGDDQ